VLTIGEDITDQRRMQKSMVVAEKMAAMGRLASGVAHEINNPLATIVTCADGLRSRLAELPAGSSVSVAFREYLDIVEQEAYRAKRITEDLLDFSRVRPSSRRVLPIDRILDRTLLVLKHHAGFKKIEVERRPGPQAPPIAVEEDAIVQVFVALIINALDAMPEGGRLTLTTSSGRGEVRCEVRDTGGGIDPASLPRIFEPFYTTKPPGRGTGLGLAVCYGIMQAHGGRIEVDSRPGVGSRFTVVLPAADRATPEEEGTIACSTSTPSGS
jgi:two-component system NtrC family sensor kinase